MKNEVRELRERLSNALLWNDNEAILIKLEKEAILKEAFEEDNGVRTERKENESLGMYIDRCSTALMKNFSRDKYELLKKLYNEYNRVGDSKATFEMVESKQGKKKDYKKQAAVGAGAVGVAAVALGVFSILKKLKKK